MQSRSGMTLFPAHKPHDPPRISELDLAYLRLKHAQSDEELRETLDLIAELQAQGLTKNTIRDVRRV